MTPDEWDPIANDLIGLWGGASKAVNDLRIGALQKRFQLERAVVVKHAAKALEYEHSHWPPMKAWHDAIRAAKTRIARVNGETEKPDEPLTPRECVERAAELVRAAAARVRSGRGQEGDSWHRYFLTLAEHYENGAAARRRGERFPWPPPAMPDAPALTRLFRDTEREDARESLRRGHEYGDG